MGVRGAYLREVNRALALALGVGVLCLGSTTGFAQDWMLGSSITQRENYNSNLLLTPNNEINAFGVLTVPRLKLQRDSPTSSVTLSGEFPFAEYFGHSDLNSQDQLLNLQANKDVSERSSLGISADFNHDTTLTSDQDITGRFLNEPVRFITWDAAPTWTYLLSPVDQLNVTASYLSTNYDSMEKTDYQYYGSTIEYKHRLSELAALTGSVSYFRFDPDDLLDTRTDIYGGLIGYEYSPTERFKVSGAVGLDYDVTHQDDTGGSTGDKTDLGYRVKFDITYDLTTRTNAHLALSHDTEPSGDGRQVTRNRGTLTVSYALGEMTTLNLNGNYADNEDYFGSGSGSERSEGLSRYWSIGPSVTWSITEDLDLSASYQLRHKIFDKDEGSATDNAAFITLRYALPDQHWSGF